MAEHGSQSMDSSNRNSRAGCENFLRDMTEEKSGKSGIVFYKSWLAQSPNEIPPNKSEMVDSPGPPKQGTEEADLLSKSVPALFDPKLPAVGPERQVAYERLVKLLRERWTLAKGERSAVELTRELRDELADEAKRSSSLGSGTRTPWRRNAIFQFEIRWSEWFLKEATIEETGGWVGVTEESPKEKPTLRVTNFAYNDRNGYGHHDDHDGYDAWSHGGGE